MRGLLGGLFRHSRCLACLLPLKPQASGKTPLAGLCSACAASLARRTSGYCPGCGALCTTQPQQIKLCPDCLLRPRPWDGIRFYAAYAGLLRELILAFKFSSSLAQRRLLSRLMFEALTQNVRPCPELDLLVPVPLHPKRLFERGYNQSLELARPLARRLGLPVRPGALSRLRYTTPQSTLSREKRLRNPSGAFAGNRDLLLGKRVLLIDDIATTGATLEAASLALSQAGAAAIEVLVLARS